MIAEFMGAEMTVTQLGVNPTNPFENSEIFTYEKPREDWPYDSSWNWLMDVVEKVESIWHDDHGYFGVHIASNGCTIQGTKFRCEIKEGVPPVYYHECHGKDKLEGTYKALTSFIEWYNKIDR